MSSSDSFVWRGRNDIEDGEAGHRWHNRISHKPNKQTIALYGYPCDLGVAANKGRTGANAGPDAIRSALANCAWHNHADVLDAGNTCVHDSLEQMQEAYAATINTLLCDQAFVIGLGGGHDIAWGSYQGLYKNTVDSPHNTIGIINFDAHFDLRIPSPNNSSGTPFYQIAEHCNSQNQAFYYACLGVAETSNTPALYQRADDLNVLYLDDIHFSLSATQTLLSPMLSSIDELYVTFCLDAFSADQAPGVSAPSVIGIPPVHVIKVIQWLASSQTHFGFRWRITDIAEMNPTYDIDGRTAKLAARLIHEICKARFSAF